MSNLTLMAKKLKDVNSLLLAFQCRAHNVLPEGGVEVLLTNFAIDAELGKEVTPSFQQEIPKQRR